MIAYLDTQVVVWLMQGDGERIGVEAKRLIEKADLRVSPIVTVELEILHEVNRIKTPWRDFQYKLQPEIGLRVCDLPFGRVTDVALNEAWTRDPFDRIIVAHAKANGFAFLISADPDIRKHYQRTIW